MAATYPPHVARRRRQLGLPVTPEEHVRYEAGEMPGSPVTSPQMAATLERWGPQCSPFLRDVLETIAARCRAREREVGEEGVMLPLYLAVGVVLLLVLSGRPCPACGRWLRHRLDCRDRSL